jgi:hypothetical protein
VPTLIHEPFDSSSSIRWITPIQGSEIAGSVSSVYGTLSVVMGVPNETGIQVIEYSQCKVDNSPVVAISHV